MTAPGRDYPRLFRAMNEVLGALSTSDGEGEALRLSFDAAADGFGAQKALLLLIEDRDPLRLQCVHVRGRLSAEQIGACERGESVKGVSPSVIRTVVAARRPELVRDPRLHADATRTSSLEGANYSVLCAPILDTLRDTPLAVVYFQNSGLGEAYNETDLAWLEGYVTAVGKAFGVHFAQKRREREMSELLESGSRPGNAPELVGESAHIRSLRRQIHEVYIPSIESEHPDPLLILGERGTGKDLIARYLYAYSTRGERAFVAVNCAEITDELAPSRLFGHKRGAFTGATHDELGLFRAAHKGVLFLDEIGDLSPRAQACLLRVLENHVVVPVGETREVPVDVAVILATNRDLDQAVRDGSLRRDVYDRFRTHALQVLPLRERPWDVPPLLEHFRSHHERRMRKRTLGFTTEALRLLVAHPWPGNVRDLARACSLFVTHAKPGGLIDVALVTSCYPEAAAAQPNAKAALLGDDVSMRDAVRAFKRELILSRLQRFSSVRAARESLRLKKTTFHRAIKALGVSLRKPKATKG
jgi:transcriptional regulator with GAF, ATPase, and Fis domain